MKSLLTSLTNSFDKKMTLLSAECFRTSALASIGHKLRRNATTPATLLVSRGKACGYTALSRFPLV